MRELLVLVPGRISTRTGGYEYDRRMMAGLGTRGWRVELQELDSSFPHPTPDALDHAAGVLAGVPAGTTVLIDGLAFGAMPAPIERHASRLKIVALVHLPLADEAGLGREAAAALEASEGRALAAAALVIVTGNSTIAALAKYGVAPDRIVVVEPGTARAPLARGSIGAPLHLLSVAAVTAGKGYDILVRALASIPHRQWLLTCAGSLERDPATVERVRATVHEHDLDQCVSLSGELDGEALEVVFSSADLFVLPTLHETYCMAVAEALAHGLPVVSTTTGAIPDLVTAEADGAHPAGLLAPPGDIEAFTKVLTQAMLDAPLRARLADGARRVRDRLPTWDVAVDKMTGALARVSDAG